MSCGCSKPLSFDSGNRAAMCQTCPQSIKHHNSAVECSVLGQPLSKIMHSANACPLGRHPDANGVVVWRGMRWLGVPEPLRWRLTWDLKREPRNLDGCGCIKALKESRIGPWLEPFLEGIPLLRKRFGKFLTELHDIA